MFTSNLFDDLISIHRNFNQLFDRALSPSRAGDRPAKDVSWIPAMDCYVKGDQLNLRVFLPGVEQKNVSVSLTDNVLVIRGERIAQELDKEARVFLNEVPYGTFERRIALPSELLTDNDKCVARFDNGVLEVTVPIISHYMQKREIPIQSATELKQIVSA
jgi:HSP20 family protein